MHAVVGKLSFDAPKLQENIKAFINITSGRSSRTQREGQYLKGVAVSRHDEPLGAIVDTSPAVDTETMVPTFETRRF